MYARVFDDNCQSSWHGTTIQLVKPLPSISVSLAASLESVDVDVPFARDETRSPMPKKKRRERTGIERKN